jgi:ABC-2 type transport system permease protein
MLDAIRAEWIKFRTVRSSVVLAFVIVLLSVAPAILVASLSSARSAIDAPANRVETLLVGVQLSNLLVGVLAVLVITQEYRFSTIRTTLAATPKRMRVLEAKAITLASICAVACMALLIVSVGVGALIFKLRDLPLTLSDATTWRVIGGTLLHMITFALACLGIGAIVRSSAGAIVVALVWPIIAEPTTLTILHALKHGSWGKWLPFVAGGQLASANHDTDFLRPWPGYLWFAAFSLSLLAFGAWLLERRDA